MTWTTVSDVQTRIGVSVTTQDVAVANEIITTYANRTPAASAAIGERDLYWLASAACWQAAWYTEQVGVLQRQIVARQRQDGVDVDYAGVSFQPKEYPVVLAPLAARALRNLSWKASRTLRVPNVATPLNSVVDFTNESSDSWHGWDEL
jgi:hypothetical protein